MKKLTQRQRVKRHLQEHGSITNVEAVNAGIFRLSERIRELEEEGLVLTKDWVRVNDKKTGTYKYTLAGGPKPRMVPVMIERDGVRYVKMVPESEAARDRP